MSHHTTARQPTSTAHLLLVAALIVGLLLCVRPPPAAYAAVNSTLFAITTGNALLRFDSATPGTILSTTAITGLPAGENLLGIDARPATGQLYALGSTSRLYTIDPTTGAAIQVGTSPFAAALSGTNFGFDVNPVPDRVRVVSDADQNLRLNPNDGTLAAVDGVLAYAAGDLNAAANPNIVGAAYTHNFAGATSTTLYGIDSNLDILVIQNPPNNGTLNTIGPLGVDTSGAVGFDIAIDGTAFAVLTVGGLARLFTVDLTTGAATQVGNVSIGTTAIRDIAVAPAGALHFSAASYVVAENSGSAVITLTRTGGSFGVVTVDFATSGGTAGAGIDYSATSGTLTFIAGEISKTFTIPILDDALAESIETINVTLSNPTGTALTTPSSAVLTIADDEQRPDTIYAITNNNNLLTFNSASPSTIASTVAVSGLSSGESILGIDFRPATGQLYALGSTSRLYIIDTRTGAATQVGANPFTPALSGVDFGFDFNPVVDRLRVVGDADQNLRLNPNTGLSAATDTTLAYAAGDLNAAANPNIVGAAYTNNFAGATTTTLYGIDSNLDILAIQNPPNTGTLNTIGSLGVDTSGAVGFDIARGGTALAALTVGGIPQLYTINLSSGAASLIGPIGGAEQIRDIAVAPLKNVYLPLALK